jgi:hypothetical protein
LFKTIDCLVQLANMMRVFPILHGAIYGLKQAPRAWYYRLSSKLQLLGFHPSKGDTSLFFFKNHDVTMYVLVYR